MTQKGTEMTGVATAARRRAKLRGDKPAVDASRPVASVFVRDGATVVTASGAFTAPAMTRVVDLVDALAREDAPIWVDLRHVAHLDLTAAKSSASCACAEAEMSFVRSSHRTPYSSTW